MFRKRFIIFSSTILILILAIACGISFDSGNEEISLEEAVAQTVTALAKSQPTQKPPTAEAPSPQDTAGPTPTPSPTPLPCNRPKFQSETIPDNTQFDPGDAFTKTWIIKNEGTCTWNSNYMLVYVSGDKMGGPSSKNLTGSVAPGETVTLSIDLTAPASNGEYKGFWKVQADDGEQFGNYWAQIIVGEPVPDVVFAVTSLTIGGDQLKVGFCPHTFNLNADIKVNAPGKVKYHWVFSNGSESDVKSVTFDAAGTKNVTFSKSFGCPGPVCPYGVQIYIDDPNHQYFGVWQVIAQCF